MLRITSFTGEIPRALPHKLPDGAAQYAEDCDFSRGDLRGFKVKALALTAPSAVKSLYRHDANWYTWTTDVDVVRGPIVDDPQYRFYWADGTNFWVSNGHSPVGNAGNPPAVGNKFHVGVPTPVAPSDGGEYGSYPIGVSGYTFAASSVAADGTSTAQSLTVSTVTAGEDYTLTLASACPDGDHLSVIVSVTPDSGSAYVGATITELVTSAYLPDRVSSGAVVATLLKTSGTSYSVKFSVDALEESRAYVVTLVNIYGEEGAPSDPLEIVATPGNAREINCTIPSNGSYVQFNKARLYRTLTGSSATDYLFQGEYSCTPGTTLTVHDSTPGDQLGEVLSTLGYKPPPQDLRNLVMLPNGIMSGTRLNEVWFSEPYLPYAWNPSNAIPLPNLVVGACAYEQSLFVTTTAYPHLISGVTPDAMTEMLVPAQQAGVSRRSIGSVGRYVAYLSNDGLVIAQGLDVSPTESMRLFTREVWRERYADSLGYARITSHDGKLYVTFDNGVDGFVLNLEEQSGLVRFSEQVDAAFIYPEADAMYIAQGVNIYAIHSGTSRLPLIWLSKEYVHPKPTNYGCIQAFGSGSVDISVYADGAVARELTLSLSSDGVIERLPSGFLAKRWVVSIMGTTGIVTEINIAHSPSELANV